MKANNAITKIKRLGAFNLVIGILGFLLALLLGSLIYETYDTSLDTNTFLISISVIIALFGILNIISSINLLRSPAKSRLWAVYSVMAGFFGLILLLGLIQMIFGVIAFKATNEIAVKKSARRKSHKSNKLNLLVSVVLALMFALLFFSGAIYFFKNIYDNCYNPSAAINACSFRELYYLFVVPFVALGVFLSFASIKFLSALLRIKKANNK